MSLRRTLAVALLLVFLRTDAPPAPADASNDPSPTLVGPVGEALKASVKLAAHCSKPAKV